jgi:hypothetical protein
VQDIYINIIQQILQSKQAVLRILRDKGSATPLLGSTKNQAVIHSYDFTKHKLDGSNNVVFIESISDLRHIGNVIQTSRSGHKPTNNQMTHTHNKKDVVVFSKEYLRFVLL